MSNFLLGFTAHVRRWKGVGGRGGGSELYLYRDFTVENCGQVQGQTFRLS